LIMEQWRKYLAEDVSEATDDEEEDLDMIADGVIGDLKNKAIAKLKNMFHSGVKAVMPKLEEE